MFLRALLVTLSILGLSACETMEGVGEDIENAGEALEEEAEEADDE